MSEIEMEIYVLCGAKARSGGAELTHQFCSAVNRLTSIQARMCYVDVKASVADCLPVDTEAIQEYEEYRTEHAKSLEEMDRKGNVIIIPEGLTLAASCISKATVIIWWMSVDNYIRATNESDLGELRKRCILHLVQSFYAKEYVENKFTAPIMWLTDYINLKHGTFLYPSEYRQDIALYNPAKGISNIQPLIEKANWLQWIPIVGLSTEAAIVVMQNAKIYVDFGNHPGKDRIPREAAVNGCCVITNKAGSAAYYEDVPIPDTYKFEDTMGSIDEINDLMHDICEHFQEHQDRFADYRTWIHEEKDRFECEVIQTVNGFLEIAKR